MFTIPRGEFPPLNPAMGNDQSILTIQVGAGSDTTPTPGQRRSRKPVIMFGMMGTGQAAAAMNVSRVTLDMHERNADGKQWPGTTNQNEPDQPSASTGVERRPAKRARAVSSPSPPGDLIINHDPARIHPNKVLISSFEGATLSDAMYGPRTAHVTMDAKQIQQRIVDSDEYKLRLQWKAANMYKDTTGVDTFDYPELTYERPPGASSSANAQRETQASSPAPAQNQQQPPEQQPTQPSGPQGAPSDIQTFINEAVRREVEKLLYGHSYQEPQQRQASPTLTDHASVISLTTDAAAANARYANAATPTGRGDERTAVYDDPPSVGQPRNDSEAESTVAMDTEANYPHVDQNAGQPGTATAQFTDHHGQLLMPGDASLPVIAQYLANPNFVSRWGMNEVQGATEGHPMHANRRLIKSPAKNPLNRLFRTDHLLDIDKHPKLNPIQPAPNVGVARARVQLAQDMLPTTIVPPIAEPFEIGLPTTADAVSQMRVRPPGPRDLMPMPEDGWPAIHRDSPRGMFRGLTEQRVEHILAQPKNNTVVLNVWGAPGAKARPIDDLYARIRALLIEYYDGFDGFQLIAPQGEWGKNVPPNSLNAPALWTITNLPHSLVTRIVDQHCLSSAEVTIFCYRPVMENPQFVMRIGKFISKDKELIRETVRELFLEVNMRYKITTLLTQNPNYAGLQANQAYAKFLTTVEIVLTEERAPNGAIDVIAAVYCDPPSNHPERWQSWADEIRRSKVEHSGFLNSGVVLPPIRCSGCHGTDHYIDNCAWPELPDWTAPLPGSNQAGNNAHWNGGAAPFQSTPRASTAGRPPNNNQFHGRRGGPSYGGYHGTPEQGQDFGRGQRSYYPG